MLVTVIALKYALLVSQQWSCGYFRKLTDLILCELFHKSSLFNSTHHVKLYPQRGDRIVTIDSVTSLLPYVYATMPPNWHPHKKTTQSLTTEPRIKRKNSISYILCKVDVWKWPVVKGKHIKMKPRIYVLFVFYLDGECKFVKNKTV